MNELIAALINFDFWSLGKIFVLIGLFVYLVFAFIVVRQVKLMTQVISGLLTGFLRAVAWAFFLFSLGIFVFTLIFF
jgi:hypothetical protein